MTYLYDVNSCLTLSFIACSEKLLDVMKKIFSSYKLLSVFKCQAGAKESRT